MASMDNYNNTQLVLIYVKVTATISMLEIVFKCRGDQPQLTHNVVHAPLKLYLQKQQKQQKIIKKHLKQKKLFKNLTTTLD